MPWSEQERQRRADELTDAAERYWAEGDIANALDCEKAADAWLYGPDAA